MLNTVHLRTFLAIVDTGTYSAAAEQLHLSQPSVSMHIRSLEEHLGNVRLFRRVGQRMIPTHAGEELLTAAREMMEVSERAEQNIHSLRGKVTGRIVIGCTHNSGEWFLPPLLALFVLQFPDVKLEIRVGSGETLLHALATQQIAMLFLEEPQRRRGREVLFLGSESLDLLVSSTHSLREQTVIAPELLRGQPLILPPPTEPLRRTIEEGLRRRSIPISDMRVVVETTSMMTMIHAVREGVGLAFIPQSCISQPESSLCRLSLGSSPLRQEWYMLRNRLRNTPRAIQEFSLFLTSPTALGVLARQGIVGRDEQQF